MPTTDSGDGEMRRWGDEEMGEYEVLLESANAS
jgi:hypothetical protein